MPRRIVRPARRITVFGEHVAENFRCSYAGNLSGQLDCKDVPTIPAGDFAAGAEQLRADLKLIGTTHVASAAVGLSDSEVWTSLHSTKPEIPGGDGEAYPLLITRAGGALVPRCENASGHVAADRLDTTAMTKI